ncbi:hypothetical protein [Aeromonas hydrophila]|uniref:hypothetical protein n=1 Tax=Aeromonas hydrophila TaxID=644 RepID=UPI003F8762FE
MGGIMSSDRAKMYRLSLLLLSLVFSPLLLASSRFSLIGPESHGDERMRYYRDVMTLALEKTRPEYGDYELVTSLRMNKARMRLEVQKRGKEALFIVDSWPLQSQHGQAAFIPFPIDFGILGYRICFVSEQKAETLGRVATLAQLQDFTQVTGSGWQDADILRRGGFKVREVDNYESLFRMVARGRSDLFCRGANEILPEWQAHQLLQPTLRVDSHVAIFYPLIHVLYSHASYKKERARLQRGILLAWQDGSLQRLWRDHFRDSLLFANLGQRRIFRLANPLLPEQGFDYRPYLYDPARDDFGIAP